MVCPHREVPASTEKDRSADRDTVWLVLKGITLNELTWSREATGSRFHLKCSRETYRAVEERSLGPDVMRQG